jgi:hypothetical protein
MDSWVELASADATRAYRTSWRLAAGERTALALFRGRLRPVVPARATVLAQLVADLDSADSLTRKKAAAALGEMREAAQETLVKAHKRGTSAQERRQVEKLLGQLRPRATERLREVRAVQVLEYLGTPDAKRLLEALAKGIPAARLTQEARAALSRLARRSAPVP